MNPRLARIYEMAWSASQLGQALQVTAQRARLIGATNETPHAPRELQDADTDALNRWMLLAADTLGIEAEPVTATPDGFFEFARDAAPALVRLEPQAAHEGARYLALVRRGAFPRIVSPDLREHLVDAVTLAEVMGHGIGAEWLTFADALLDAAQVPEARRAAARWNIVAAQAEQTPVPCGWLLRLSPGTNLFHQFSHSGIPRLLAELALAQSLQLLLLVATWWFIGFITFSNSANPAWLVAWALVLFSTAPAQLWMSNAQSQFAAQLGLIFRQRLLYGTLQLKPDEIRLQGIGQFIERVLMAENIESLAVGGGLLAVLALFQLGAAFFILAQGAGGAPHALVLLAFTILMIAIEWNYYRKKRAWVINYRTTTNRLVERLLGHRTRLAQQDPREWHTEEDAELERYVKLTARFDRSFVPVGPLPWLWMVPGLAGLAPAFLPGGVTLTGLALSLGGILLAYNAFTTIVGGISTLVNSVIASEQVTPLFDAAARYAPISQTVLEQSWREPDPDRERSGPVLRARNLTFRYRPGGRAVLRDVNLDVHAGDRLLLEGPSGGGKTTLAAVLAGLRAPEAGHVIVGGFAQQNVESQVTPRRVAMAPQFHENYIFNATFGFNLLMGRRWPPSAQDLADAHAICRELRLDELLARMPQGMNQIVGESGWQLSHGERSRVYIARVLLQKADLVILDESFGALDPENLRDALKTTLARAKTLMVIAHP
jgi:ATP-binding cassette subfamily B protein